MSTIRVCNTCGMEEKRKKVQYCAHCGGSSFASVLSKQKKEPVEDTSPIVIDDDFIDDDSDPIEYRDTPKWYILLLLVPGIITIIFALMGGA